MTEEITVRLSRGAVERHIVSLEGEGHSGGSGCDSCEFVDHAKSALASQPEHSEEAGRDRSKSLIDQLRTEVELQRQGGGDGYLADMCEEAADRFLARPVLNDDDQARLELIRDHDGNDLSEKDKALLTLLAAKSDQENPDA